MKAFSFSVPKDVHFGNGELDRIPRLLGDHESEIRDRRILVLTDVGIGGSGIPQRVAKALVDAGYATDFVDSVPREPYAKDVEKLADELKSLRVGCVVGIGGGSVLDTAKLLAVMLRSGGDIATLMETGPKEKGLVCILVPTTAGTGSEATPNAIVALRERKLKVGIVSPFFIPDHVVLDAEATRTLPGHLTASTGVDAYCHVLECYLSKKANPYSDMVALEGIKLIDGSILTAFQTGNDLEARERMLLGSFYGGLSIAASGTTAVHALSYPLGGKYRIPHGVANAILLVPVMEFNKPAVEGKLASVAEAIGLPGGEDDSRAAQLLIDHLREMIVELRIPNSLSALGIETGAIPDLAESAFGVKRLLNNNPREVQRSDIRTLYESIR